MERVKQVILIRRDLHMRRGKEIAQGSHAAMEFLLSQLREQIKDSMNTCEIRLSSEELQWIVHGTAKVCLRVDSEEELLRYHREALDAGLTCHLIQDSGRTEFHGKPTFTACCIGPHAVSKIDAITQDLVPY